MLGRLFARRRPPAPAISAIEADINARLAKRKAARAANRERAERAAATRLRERLARDPLYNRRPG